MSEIIAKDYKDLIYLDAIKALDGSGWGLPSQYVGYLKNQIRQLKSRVEYTENKVKELLKQIPDTRAPLRHEPDYSDRRLASQHKD